MFDFTFSQIVILAIFAFAGVLHGLTGIGITLIATTALASIYPLSQALVLALLPSLIINAIVFFNGGRLGFYIKKYWLLALVSFIGSLFGTKLLFIISQNILLVSLGIVILSYVCLQWFGKSIRFANTRKNLIICGLASGIVGGATNAMSPILMMYLLSATDGQDNAKTEMIKASNFCYLVGKIAQLLVLWQAIITLPKVELNLIFWLSIISLLCLYVGFYFREKISATLFKQLILIILLILGVKVLLKGFGI